ncbi:hypothetical protein U942_00769 [Staphylococcus aureus Sau 194]|nr:hypothetical protein U942_00769 [Staphylococcus aureus Sau 194]
MNIVMWKTGSIKLDNVVLKLIVLKKINIMNMGEKNGSMSNRTDES